MRLLRLYQILAALKAYNVLPLLPKSAVPAKLKWIMRALFWVKAKDKHQSVGKRVQHCFEALGPIWIKFGQLLSTRRDLLPIDIANALEQLQDQVAPFASHIARQEIERALGCKIETYFADFNPNPLASASIAQVHTAILKQGEIPVVLKILRPNIKPIIKKDLDLMLWLAKKLEQKSGQFKKFHPLEIVQDYQKIIFNELNLEREAFNTKTLRQNFLNSEMLYIPYVYEEFSRPNLMVSERVFAVPLSDLETLKRHQTNLKLLAERGVDVFFQQVFRDNFFHADMHPGNIFVDISNPIDPFYIGIDCAIMGSLTQEDQTFLAQTFIAFFNRDYQAIAQLYIESGWVDENTDPYLLQSTFKRVCDPFFNKSLGEISFAQVLLELFKVARQFGIEIQPQLVLLQKTLFYVEGLGRQLYPALDLWQTAKPYLENWYKDQYRLKTIATQLKADLPHWRDFLLNAPKHWQQDQKQNKKMQQTLKQLELKLEQSQQQQKRLLMCVCVGFVILVGLMML